MDGSRFDTLSRSLIAARSRRRALGGVLLGACGLLGSRTDEAAAKKKKPCPPCKKRKKGKCKGLLPDGTACAGGTCQGGSCVACVGSCAGRQCGDDGCGGSCGTCSPGQTCQGSTCVTLVCGHGGVCRVFVTSSQHNGILGGLTGADAICQARADAVGLPGTYKAWLSDSTQSPATRFTHSPGPYQLVTGTSIANDWADLTDGTLAAAIQRTEGGSIVDSGGGVWTNTLPDGTRESATNHCTDWTEIGGGKEASVGSPDFITMGWTSLTSDGYTGSLLCSASEGRLYCFQQS